MACLSVPHRHDGFRALPKLKFQSRKVSFLVKTRKSSRRGAQIDMKDTVLRRVIRIVVFACIAGAPTTERSPMACGLEQAFVSLLLLHLQALNQQDASAVVKRLRRIHGAKWVDKVWDLFEKWYFRSFKAEAHQDFNW